jgi:Domain of unknown function (DUF4347)/Cadherin domain/Right handed beta helix region/Laminin G domain
MLRWLARLFSLFAERGAAVRKPVVEEMEPRILYSADANPLLWGGVDPNATAIVAGIDGGSSMAPAQTADAQQQRRREIIFVDAAVVDSQTLVDALVAQRGGSADIEVVQLRADADGLAQIDAVLSGERGIDALHIVSHGEAGRLQLGNGFVDSAVLQEHAAALGGWQQALNADADILLFGCNVGEGAAGEAFIGRLAALTGADVAASVDATGATARGGDWDLEARTGAIETAIDAAAPRWQAWDGRLDITTGLIGRWRFDANANDFSGNGYNGTLANGALIDTTAGTNRIGGGKLFLDGSNDRVDLSASIANFSSLTQGTISAWIKTSDTVGVIYEVTNTTSSSSYAVFGILGGQLNFNVRQSGTDSLNVTTTASVNDNNWHHVAVTVGPSGNTLYIDGVAQAVTYSTGNAAAQRFYNNVSGLNVMEIGVNQTSGGPGAQLAALMDDVRFYNRALSSTDMAQLYAFAGPGITVTPVVGLSTTEAGGTAQFSVVLNDAPTATVTIPVSSSDTTEGTVSTTLLTFTTANWNVAQTVTVTGANDALADGFQAYTAVLGAATSTDGNYSGRDAADVQLANSDDDINYGMITVDTTSDVADGATTSLAALAANRGADGVISLREAIIAANNTANGAGGADRIAFAIPVSDPNYAGGVFTIAVSSALPQITGALTIDGTTQATNIGNTNAGLLGTGGVVGADSLALSQVERPEIQIVDGNNLALGLDIQSSDVTVRGLAIYGFGSGSNNTGNIYVGDGFVNLLIEQNIIGTGAAAFSDPGAGARTNGSGIISNGADGATVRDNLIGFNGYAGMRLNGSSTGWTIQNNEIRGNAILGTGDDGIGSSATSAGNTIARNLLTANIGNGIDFVTDGGGHTVSNNTISGNGSGGNQTFGIALRSSNNTVQANTITGNSGSGITVNNGATGNAISRNSIFSNGAVGIDLQNASDNALIGTAPYITANDVGDADAGGNGLQNFPALTSANSNAAGTTIVGTINSNANTTYRIEYFANRPGVADATNGEGERYLGFITVTTDGSGNASVNTTLANVWVNSGDRITATATVDLGGGNYGATSEYAANVTASSSGIIVVDTTSDTVDGTTTSIANLGAARGGDGRISLREAIIAANNTANGGSADRIVFNIPVSDANHFYYRDNGAAGTFAAPVTTTLADAQIADFDADYLAGTARSWYRISLSGNYLDVTQAVIIDGSTQAGFISGSPVIEINAAGVTTPGDANAIALTAGASTIRGLVINSAGDNAIEIDTAAGGSTIVGNFIGTDVSGTLARANSTIGTWGAIGIKATNVVVGGIAAADRNVISGNAGYGIEFYSSASGSTVVGNYIGTTANGAAALSNTAAGVFIRNSSNNNTIGGTSAGQGNLIAHNGGDGIWVDATAAGGNALLGNTIHSNSGQAIDLGADGITANDLGDGDTGPNALQNFPVLSSANSNITGTTIAGSLNSTASTSYRIEFYANRPTVADAANGEGERYLGFINVTTDGSGNATINTTLANVWVNSGDRITATATNLTTNNTSEFGANVVASSTGIVVVDTVSDVADGTTTSITNLGNARGADGRISLREAIVAANNTANGGTPDKIVFNIAGSGVHTITLSSLLPTISSAMVIDASTDDSFAANGSRPAIVLNGNNTVQDGLRLYTGSDGSAVRGLVIQGFTQDGIDIASSSGNTIAGNWVGLTSAGTAAAGNGNGVNIFSGNSNVIGGITAADRNVISGNSSPGVWVGGGASANQIIGNYIGTNAAGTAAVGNGGAGVAVYSAGNVVGGTAAGSGNVISGNAAYGIRFEGSAATGNSVAGNFIGLNAAGTAMLGNANDGVFIIDGASSNTIGGTTVAHRNVIAGNSDGVQIGGSAGGSNGNTIQGNYIGTDVTGTLDFGNNDDGIDIDNAALNNQVIGNLISGNTGDGIDLGDAGASTGTVIRGNLIGTQANGSSALGNGGHGILVGNGGSANSTTIGGTTAGQGNTIAFSGGDGIYVAASTSVSILGNTVHSNTGLAIDLGANGVTANDVGDADSGANNLQNFPVLASAATTGTQITIVGSLNSVANSYYRIEFYANTSGDASGNGEGQTFIGFANVATDAAGNATFSATLTQAVPAGAVISATATRSDAAFSTFTDTSEFAANVVAFTNAAPVLDASKSPALATINEDAGAPVGAVGTLVSSLVDFASPAGQVDNVTDANSGAQLGIAVTAADTTNGAWWYSTDNGTNWSALGAVSNGSARLLAADANTRLYFQPNANYNGTIANAITFRAWDQTSGTAGGTADTSSNGGTTAFSSALDSASITVTAVNDAPSATNLGAAETYTEDTALNLTDIVISDIDSANVTATLTLSNVAAGSLNTGTSGAVTSTYDAGTGVWSASGAVADVNALLAALTFTPTANFNAGFTIATSVSDGVAPALTGSKSMTGTAVNDAPVITSNGGGATAAVNVAENQTAVTTVTSTDVDGGAAIYSIVGGADAALFSINASTGALSFIGGRNYEAPSDAGADNVYDVTVQVADGNGGTDTQAVAVSVTPVNEASPVITSNGGGTTAAISVAENVAAVTTVTSTDADLPAPTLTYSISGGADAARFSIDVSTGVLAFVAAPDHESPVDSGADNIYEVIVTVSDGSLTDAQTIVVTVTPVNDNAPVITSNGGGATASVSIAENASAVTTVVASDADLPAQTLTYSIVGGADQTLFTINAATGALTFNAAPNFESPTDAGGNNIYDVQVQVSDGTLIDTQTIAVTVTNVNEAPVIISSAAVGVAENQTAAITVTSADVDGGAPSYSIVGGADQALFSINAATGALSFNSSPNFESPADAGGNNVYDVQVRVSDGALSATQNIAITVGDVNEFAVSTPVDSNGAANSVAETAGIGAVVGVTAFAADADGTSNAITYTLDDNAGGRFAINAGSGVVTVTGALDHETNTSHAITVRATSADGSFATALFTIAVTDVNEAGVGVISDANASANAVNENAALNTPVGITALASDPDGTDTVTYSLADSAGGRFAINASTGVVVVNGALDAESAGSHTITVRADSSDGSFNTQVFTITVADQNEFAAGAISDANAAANTVAENAGVGATVGITALASDADATNNTIAYTLDDSAGGRFAIDANSGVVTLIAGLDYESASSHAIVVRATSADGSFSTAGFTINVGAVNDNAPVIGSNGGGASAAISVAENSTGVTTVIASDADLPAQTLIYSISGGADAARFTIDANTGALSFITAPDFEAPSDAGANNIYDVTVQVADGNGGFDTQAIAVTVSDVSSTLVVTTTADSNDTGLGASFTAEQLNANRGADGAISLREAIIAANNTTNPYDVITFNIAGAGVHTINVAAALPTITGAVQIDGWSQGGFAGTPLIELNGNYAASGVDGLTLGAGSSGSTVRGLIINRFTGNGIEIDGSGYHTLQGNWIGLDDTGAAAAANVENGIYATASVGNLIGGATAAERNVISGNGYRGIHFVDVDGSTIAGNYIGTNASGTADVNGAAVNLNQSGIVLASGSDGNVVGGATAAARNVVSGNNHYGVEFQFGSQNNRLEGNFIGTTASGLVALGNLNGGVAFWNAGSGNVVGGGGGGAGNVISGNGGIGVLVGNASVGAVIQGNLIGLGVDGYTALGNGTVGVLVNDASVNTLIGTDANGVNDAAERNVISANGDGGVVIVGVGTIGTRVQGNYIGTNAAGTAARGNTFSGVAIFAGASGNTVGGTATGAGNLLSGNGDNGITLADSGTSGNLVQGNVIGLNATQTALIGNASQGIWIGNGASGNTVGGAVAGAGNVIGGSGAAGIELHGAATSGNTVAGNFIGTDATGTANFGNGSAGVVLFAGAGNNTIGGAAAGAGNLIANNALVGVAVDAASSGNAILRNAIRDNGGLGIDLEWDGATPNDAGDANGLQNFPVLGSANSTGGNTTITGTINSTANTTLRIEFFSSPTGDASGHGEGAIYLGFATVTTNGSGNAAISSTLAGVSVTAGHVISATATIDQGGGTYRSTSEFSANVICQTPPINSVPGAQSVNEDTALVIGGVSVADPDGNLATVRLAVSNGTLNVSLAGGATVSAGANGSATLTLAGTQAQINAALAAIGYQGGNHFNGSDTLTVLATDALGATDSDSVAITVTAVNDAPVITSHGGGATAGITVAENLGTVGSVTASDVDGGTAVYSIIGGADAARFAIDSATGALTFIAAPDFEAPSDVGGDNIYDVTVQVADGNGGFDTQAIAVTVSDVASTLLVTTTADIADSGIAAGNAAHTAEWLNANRGGDGAISLREAIIAANNSAGADTITFNLAGAGVQTIHVAAALPPITGTVVIDGASEPDFAGTPVVELNGAAAGANVDGLWFAAGSGGSTVRGLIINRFSSDGVFIDGVNNTSVQGSWIGLDASGSTAAGNGDRGIFAIDGSGHQISGNVIAGNARHGILLGNVGNSVIAGNLIGTDAAGLADVDGVAFNPSGSGILLLGSSGNLIGGTTAAARNVISGNNHFGVEVGSGSQNNRVQGNFIGTDIGGANALGNSTSGVGFWGAGTGNVLGGGQAGAGNLISGNAGSGVLVANGSTGVVIQGNTIGLRVDGNSVLANGQSGVLVTGVSTNTLIGTDADGSNDAAERNVISGNLNNGVGIENVGTTGTVVAGNFIGTNASGSAARGNGWNGVSMSGGVTNNTIGGTAVGAGNLISGNVDSGIAIVDSGTSGNVVLGNVIGLDAAQTAVIGNTGQGLWIGVGASGNTVGGTAAGAANIIGGNGFAGVVMWGAGTDGNSVIGNIIGTDAGGTANFGNGRGVVVVAGASNTLVGGTAAGAGNLIANNIGDGVYIDVGSGGNAVLGNSIRGNGGLGIDQDNDGVTANDAGDADGGANGLQNFPVLGSANSIGGNTTISGTIDSTPNTALRIEFFSAPTGDASGYGEGQNYLGFVDVTTDAAGNASFVAVLNGVTVSAGHAVSATGTVDLGGGNYGDTSEFSAHVACTNNSSPVNVLPGAQTVNEDTLLAIGGLSVGDAQGNLASVQLSVGQGTLAVNLSGGATISAGANSSATLTLAGTQAQINSALATLGYRGNANYFGADTLAVVSTDSLGASDSDTVAITVGAVNDAPLVTSAGAVTVAENQTAVVTVTSSDVDGGAPVYTIVGGADAALFTIDPATGVLTFIAAPNFEASADAGANNVYDVTVQVSDGALSAMQAITVTVTNVNEAPSITSAGAVSVAENQTAVMTVASSDVDGGAPIYTIVGGADAALFTIDPATGVLTFNAAPNFEAPADAGANNVYDVIVQVADGNGGVATQAMAVAVRNVNEAPTITSLGGGAAAGVSIAENLTAVATVTSTDVDGGAATYSIVGGADAARFTIDAAAGALRFSAAPDFEAPADADRDNVYELTVQVADGNGGTATQSIAVAVSGVNEAPANIAPPAAVVAEQASAGTVVAIVTASDPDAGDLFTFTLVNDGAGRFVIDPASGRLTVAPGARLDFESAPSHTLVVRVTDAQGLRTEQTIVVTLRDVIEALPDVVPPDITPPPSPAPAPAPAPAAPAIVPVGSAASGERDRNAARIPAATPSGGATVDVTNGVEDGRSSWQPQRGRSVNEGGPLLVASVSFTLEGGAADGWSQGAQDDLLLPASEGTAPRFGLFTLRGSSLDAASNDDGLGAVRGSTEETVLAALQDPVRVASVTLTAGFVWWLTRSGGLLTSILMGIPAWRHVDLLPVLAPGRDDDEEEETDSQQDEAEPSRRDSQIDDLFSNTSRMFGESRYMS